MFRVLNAYQRAISLLASQFRDQKRDGGPTNLQKMLRALIAPAQELQDVVYELYGERWLQTAIGYQLDQIGDILGLTRADGESDDDYRERLQFQIFINTSKGAPETIIQTLKFLTRASHIGYFERNAAFFQLETDGTNFPSPPNELNDAIFSVSPVGVNYAPIVCTFGDPISLEFSGDVRSDALYVAPDLSNPLLLANLLIESPPIPDSILYVLSGAVEETGPNGTLDELNYPLDTAGRVAELIQKNGNFPPEE